MSRKDVPNSCKTDDSENAESGRIIPDIPEILKEKEQPKVRSKKPIFVIAVLAFFVLIAVAGVAFSALTTVEIAGTKYSTKDSTLILYDAVLTADDIESVQKMKSLSYIKLSNCTLPDTDMSWVTDAATVSLENCSLTDAHIATIDFASLELNSLELDGNKGITDLSALAEVADTLTTLSFNNCSVKDISFVSELTKLTSFYADSNLISDISAFSACTRLQVVSIKNNDVSSLESLKNCTGLTMIYAGSNNIGSLKGVETCRSLTYLDLSDNELSSLEYLPALSQYNTHLDLSNNLLTDVSLPEISFTSLMLYGNNLQSLDIAKTYGDALELGYIESFDYASVSGKYSNYKFVDIPADKQNAISAAVNSDSVTFVSQEIVIQ